MHQEIWLLFGIGCERDIITCNRPVVTRIPFAHMSHDSAGVFFVTDRFGVVGACRTTLLKIKFKRKPAGDGGSSEVRSLERLKNRKLGFLQLRVGFRGEGQQHFRVLLR